MKGYRVVYLLLAASLLPPPAHAGSCNPHAQRRVVKGPQPTANTLYAHIQHVGAGSWQAGFDTETFVYVGDVHAKSGKIYKIGHLKTLALRDCTPFQRLFIFDAKDHYLGQYAPVEVDPKRIMIQGTELVFPFRKNDGNTLDLKDGPPVKTRLDGDDIGWEPAPDPGTAPPP
ncbi:MAG TPA: hypothetical protein VGT99_14010 [Gammaproteobacteria bacterium]|nr:hypothetical protein [Gammaproteobacteria bacterium]